MARVSPSLSRLRPLSSRVKLLGFPRAFSLARGGRGSETTESGGAELSDWAVPQAFSEEIPWRLPLGSICWLLAAATFWNSLPRPLSSRVELTSLSLSGADLTETARSTPYLDTSTTAQQQQFALFFFSETRLITAVACLVLGNHRASQGAARVVEWLHYVAMPRSILQSCSTYFGELFLHGVIMHQPTKWKACLLFFRSCPRDMTNTNIRKKYKKRP